MPAFCLKSPPTFVKPDRIRILLYKCGLGDIEDKITPSFNKHMHYSHAGNTHLKTFAHTLLIANDSYDDIEQVLLDVGERRSLDLVSFIKKRHVELTVELTKAPKQDNHDCVRSPSLEKYERMLLALAYLTGGSLFRWEIDDFMTQYKNAKKSQKCAEDGKEVVVKESMLENRYMGKFKMYSRYLE